jgi:hypothetical protein
VRRLDGRYDMAFHFQPRTHADPRAIAQLSDVDVVVNRHCTDVSKALVQREFESIFGYPLAVDPTAYAGPLVEKSDENYRHDGRILEGPIPASAVRHGCVYQRVVRNEEDQQHVLDLRVPIYGGHVPLIYRRRRRVEHRFGHSVDHSVSAERSEQWAQIVKPEDVLDVDEVALLAMLAERLSLDYCEMDVLRDNEDGRIYVVDVNNTPGGPVAGLDPADGVPAVSKLSEAFEALIGSLSYRHSREASERVPK